MDPKGDTAARRTSTSPATGEYRLWRQAAGIGHFAHVRVRLADAVPSTPRATWRADPDDGSSFRPDTDREFVDAAVAGAADGLDLAARCGADASGVAVEVVHGGLNLADTTVSAVRAAAALAVADALGVVDRLRPVFRDEWTVELVR